MGLGFVRWGSMTLDVHRGYPPSPFHGGESLCSCAPPHERLLAGCVVVWEGDQLPSLLPPQYTKGDDGPDTEESELGSQASGFQNKRRRRPKWMDTPFGWGHPLDKWAVIPASPLAWADGGPICEVYTVCAAFAIAISPFSSELFRFVDRFEVPSCTRLYPCDGVRGIRNGHKDDHVRTVSHS